MTDTLAERTALHDELLGALVAAPEIFDRAFAPPDPYAEEKAADLDLIAGFSDLLFSPARAGIGQGGTGLAVLVQPSCADCVTSLTELIDLATSRPDLRISVIDLPQTANDPRPMTLAALLDQHGASAALEARRIWADRPDSSPDEVLSSLGLTVTAHPLDLAADVKMAETLGLDLFPSYVLPQMMIRGAIPGFVLEGYLE